MERFDHVIVGGGIVGLASAWGITERFPGTRVAVLDKEDGWAHHQTGRNSGVIHSGIYYKPGSLKATLCRDGNRRLQEFCTTYGIQFEICGKMIVAKSETELIQLNKLYDRGIANGLKVQMLGVEQVRELEPNVSCLKGVNVPSTGIVDYAGVCRKLAELVHSKGGTLLLGTRVQGFREDGDVTVLETSKGPIAAKMVVNCAGLHSDRVARLAGARPDAKIVPFRGEYYELRPDRRQLVRNLIYPVPDPQFPFLGVHFTRMIDGSVHAGPNAVLSFKREGYHRTSFNLRDAAETMAYPGFWRLASKHLKMGLSEMHRSFSKAAFVRSLQTLIPSVTAEDLIPSKAGVRAQALRRDGSLVDDFMIVRQGRTVHVCNAPSPAATASLEIGRYITEHLGESAPA